MKAGIFSPAPKPLFSSSATANEANDVTMTRLAIHFFMAISSFQTGCVKFDGERNAAAGGTHYRKANLRDPRAISNRLRRCVVWGAFDGLGAAPFPDNPINNCK